MDMARYTNGCSALTSKSREILEETTTTNVNRPNGSRILRSVERVGHFRRAYGFSPSAGVAETKTLEQHVFLLNFCTIFVKFLQFFDKFLQFYALKCFFLDKFNWFSRFFLQSLRTEIDNHEPWVQKICDNGRKLIQEGHENAREFELKINELLNAWKELKDSVEDRRKRLAESEKAHQVIIYVFNC